MKRNTTLQGQCIDRRLDTNTKDYALSMWYFSLTVLLPPCLGALLLATYSSAPAISAARRLAAALSSAVVHLSPPRKLQSAQSSSGHLENSLFARGSTPLSAAAARFLSSSLSRWILSGTKTIEIHFRQLRTSKGYIAPNVPARTSTKTLFSGLLRWRV